MIGAVIQGVGIGSKGFDPLVYHHFGGRACIDIVTDNCLLAPQIQKVIISIPMTERKNVSGVVIGHKSKLNTSKRESLGRSPNLNYYEPASGVLGGLYMAALQNGLDHIVRIYANCPTIPAWLINKVVYRYYRGIPGDVLSTMGSYEEGFRIDVFPFWVLAEAYMNQENRDDLEVSESYRTRFKNEESSYIPATDFGLAFTHLSQAEKLDSIIHNIDNGYDIADILEDKNGHSEKDTEEQHEAV